MEMLKRMLMAEQARGGETPDRRRPDQSSPSKGKYKSQDGPRTKAFIYPTSSTPPLHTAQADGVPASSVLLGGNAVMPSPGLTDAGAPQHHQKSRSRTPPPAIALPDDEADLRLAPDFSAVAAMGSQDRDKAIQEMMNQAVVVEDDVDPADALVKGMSVSLMRHQVQGFRWMKQREAGKYKGGILADDMGLGKTIQALALIVGNSADTDDSTITRVVEEAAKAKPGSDKTKLVRKDAVADSKDEKDESNAGEPSNVAKGEPLEIKSKATLIVAPVSVIRQWEREALEKTNCGIRVFVHHGAGKSTNGAHLKKYDVVLTSFSTAASEYASVVSSGGDRTRSPLFKARWLRVILDEAHNIKNHKTQQALACFELARRAHSRWCLTGTPIQNNPYEMFSLIHFLGIPPFNEYDAFKEKIAEPLKSANQNRVNWGMKRLCLVLQTVLLRRTKDAQVDGQPLLTLPNRIVEIVSEAFDNDAERQFYESWEKKAQSNLSRESHHIGKLVLLLRLRQATSHPLLVTKQVESDADAMAVAGERKAEAPSRGRNAEADASSEDELADLISNMNVGTIKCSRCKGVLTEGEVQAAQTICEDCARAVEQEARQNTDWNQLGSTKIRIMLRLLEQIRASDEAEKTIIFSQFTSFLDLAETSLRSKGYRYARYDGSMRPKDREAALADVRDNPETKIILISFKAGSTGLNLTCCSRVILMDLWYNPMLEEQGMDRAHRVGQKRDVYMYKVCIKDTVEQRILALQEKKRELSKAALEGSKLRKGGNSLSKQELLYLFNGGDQVPSEQPRSRNRS
ncbi:unnamed protein product [Parajaminaea phylloscopi]